MPLPWTFFASYCVVFLPTLSAGIGRSIFEACEKQSKEFGVAEFECCSSLVAEGYYARLGLQTIETKEVTLREVAPTILSKIMKTRDTSP